MMDMYSRNQYLKQLRLEYLKTKSKKTKSQLLNEAEKRTGLNRKYLMEKLKPRSNLDKDRSQKKANIFFINFGEFLEHYNINPSLSIFNF